MVSRRTPPRGAGRSVHLGLRYAQSAPARLRILLPLRARVSQERAGHRVSAGRSGRELLNGCWSGSDRAAFSAGCGKSRSVPPSPEIFDDDIDVGGGGGPAVQAVSYTHLRAHETGRNL